MYKEVVLLQGDGIGPEICSALKDLYCELKIPIKWIEMSLTSNRSPSKSCFNEEVIDAIEQYRYSIKGPTTTPSGFGHKSLNVALRKKLDLFANIRPAKSFKGLKGIVKNLDIIVIRENLEDTYAGIEYKFDYGYALGFKVATRQEAERFINFSLNYANKLKRNKITLAHKSNIHKDTDGTYLNVFKEAVSAYEIKVNDILIDNLCMQLVKHPNNFDVIVMQNLYGDIVSDLCAGLVGGLGIAPSANIGERAAVFEAVHGSAPDIAGKGIANPLALILSANIMLKLMGLSSYANAINKGIEMCFLANLVTQDLGGSLKTDEFIKHLAEKSKLHLNAEEREDPFVIEFTQRCFKNLPKMQKEIGAGNLFIDVLVTLEDFFKIDNSYLEEFSLQFLVNGTEEDLNNLSNNSYVKLTSNIMIRVQLNNYNQGYNFINLLKENLIQPKLIVFHKQKDL